MNDFTQYLPLFNSAIVSIGLLVGVGVFIWRTVKSDNSKYDDSTIEKYESAVKGRDLEIDGLKKQIAMLTTQIETLNTQVKALQDANLTLQNTIQGKDMLVEIQKALAPVPGFFAPGGALETFLNNDKIILEQLRDIHTKINRNERESKKGGR